jgi:hypothetical protein
MVVRDVMDKIRASSNERPPLNEYRSTARGMPKETR